MRKTAEPAVGEAVPTAKTIACDRTVAESDVAPTLSNLIDEWDSLEARIRFYTAGAESIAGMGSATRAETRCFAPAMT
ncbi:hypothetical protein DLJ53_03170 [Acuticoccus sediminis]|uniref:Uncharacterized protein n=1 Tax=Acuticoccus sediminis TaxID=2184697 RepID=A0A8B2NVW8_9HYPH|nr:hypothetical protein DLJ53_03170 [Acuticoccus sediminis]